MFKKLKDYNVYNTYLGLFSIISTLFYGVVKTLSFLKFDSPIGDENSVIAIFESIKTIGFFETWQSGNFSPVFFLITHPLNLVLDNAILASRLISSTAVLLSLFLLYKFAKSYLKLSGTYMFSALVFTASFFFYRIYWQGINDTLFHLIIIASLFCCYNIQFKKKTIINAIVLGVLIGLLIGTRFIAFLVIPGYIFFLYKNYKHVFITGFVGLLIGLCLHLPSLLENNTLSSIDKNPKNGLSWAQKNHLSQRYIYEGKLKDGVRVNWQQVQDYIDENGEDSLPYSFSDSLLFNPKWTIIELFNDFWFSLKGYWTFFGLGLLLLLWFTFKGVSKVKLMSESFKFTYNFLLFFWLHTFFVSLVVLVQIEFRWYSAFIYLAILFFHHMLQNYKSLFDTANCILFINLNYIMLIGFHLHYLFIDYNPLSAFIRKTLRLYFR
jgi:hypothetical protein